jgi:hypothetical protein
MMLLMSRNGYRLYFVDRHTCPGGVPSSLCASRNRTSRKKAENSVSSIRDCERCRRASRKPLYSNLNRQVWSKLLTEIARRFDRDLVASHWFGCRPAVTKERRERRW